MEAYSDVEEMDLDVTYHIANYSVVESFANGDGLNFTVSDVSLPVSTADYEASGTISCSVLFRFIWYTVITGTLCLLGLTATLCQSLYYRRTKETKWPIFYSRPWPLLIIHCSLVP